MKSIMKRTAATVAVAAPALAPAEALAPMSAHSTAYCLSGTMADGTRVRSGSVAMNRHRLGTRITLVGRRGPDGGRRYTVRDRIGWGSELDFWVGSCATARGWGRRTVRYRLGW